MNDPGVFQSVADYIRLGKEALDLIRATLPFMPATKRTDAEAAILAASGALERSRAEFQKAMGYHMCQCKSVPEGMLWREKEKAFVRPNEACGRRIEEGHTDRLRISPSGGWMSR